MNNAVGNYFGDANSWCVWNMGRWEQWIQRTMLRSQDAGFPAILMYITCHVDIRENQFCFDRCLKRVLQQRWPDVLIQWFVNRIYFVYWHQLRTIKSMTEPFCEVPMQDICWSLEQTAAVPTPANSPLLDEFGEGFLFFFLSMTDKFHNLSSPIWALSGIFSFRLSSPFLPFACLLPLSIFEGYLRLMSNLYYIIFYTSLANLFKNESYFS